MTVVSQTELVLGGCRAEPLLSYLKALGVLRLVATQFDKEACGRWLGDTFALTSSLTEEQLVEFFLGAYAPSPILAPWNKDGGFLRKGTANTDAVQTLLRTNHPRFTRYRAAGEVWHGVLRSLKFREQKDLGDKKRKAALIAAGRGALPDDALEWLDAVLVLGADDEPDFMPLLGTGGNDGNFDFTGRFAGRLVDLLLAEQPNIAAANRVTCRHALFGDGAPRLSNDPVGMFDPAGVGGRNAGPDHFAGSLVNPWDFVIGLEGSLSFAGSASRRLQGGARATFPFTVRVATAAGFGTAAVEPTRGETWLPLWGRRASWREIRALMTEGRLQQGRRQAGDGLSIVSAIKNLGSARGVDRFARTAYAKRNGRSFLAISAGRYSVGEPDDATALLGDCEEWTTAYRRAASDAGAPRHARAVGALEECIFGLLRASDLGELGRARAVQGLLVALGKAEQAVAEAPKFRKDKRLRPLVLRRAEWSSAADDGSDEFEFAAALAASEGHHGEPPMRSFWEPVALLKGRLYWTTDDRSVVAKAGAHERRFAAVFARRSLQAHKSACDDAAHDRGAPACSAVVCRLTTVEAWLEGRLDAARIWELFVGLSLLERPRALRRESRDPDSGARNPTDYAFAVFRLLAAPYAYSVTQSNGSPRLSVLPSTRDQSGPIFDGTLATLIRNGALGPAFERAVRRWRAYGIAVKGTRLKRASSASLTPPIFPPGYAHRLPAALMAPVSKSSLHQLGGLAFYLEGSDSDESESVTTSTSG